MLGKTANGLFWMSRYLERAENIARLIETGQRIALTRLSDNDDEWASVLQSAGTYDAFRAAGHDLSRDAAVDWMLRGAENSSSVLACIKNARQNARLTRTRITGEVWESVNAGYMTLCEMLKRKVSERDLPHVLRTIRQHASLQRGMVHGTMMRSESFDFIRIGTFLERADSTARILDVKYYVLLPSVSAVGSSIDNVQWESILRSVSARGGFRMAYGPRGGPRDIANFLILDTRMPRSLAFCIKKIRGNLRYLNSSEAKPGPSLRKVGEIEKKFLSHDIASVFDYGLHEFIQDMLGEISGLAYQIEQEYRFNE